jgi:Glycine-rich domain
VAGYPGLIPIETNVDRFRYILSQSKTYYEGPSVSSGVNTSMFGPNEKWFYGSGTTTFTVPTGKSTIWVSQAGGGGSGATSGTHYYGGDSGELKMCEEVSVTAGETLDVTIGAGGVYAAGGNDGGATTLKRGATTLVSCSGGKKGGSGSPLSVCGKIVGAGASVDTSTVGTIFDARGGGNILCPAPPVVDSVGHRAAFAGAGGGYLGYGGDGFMVITW